MIVPGSPPVDAVPSPPEVDVGGSTRVVIVTTVVTLSELRPEEESDVVVSVGEGSCKPGMSENMSDKDVCRLVVSGPVPLNVVGTGAGCGVSRVMVALTNCRLTLRGKYIRGRSSSALTTDAVAASAATRRPLLCMLKDKLSRRQTTIIRPHRLGRLRELVRSCQSI
jgi:hypothetical protein